MEHPRRLDLFERTRIDVIGTNNIVLGKVAADLDLDNFERDLSRIFKSMPVSGWNIDALILAQQTFGVSNYDFGCTVHDGPMFGPVMMHLQRELRTGFHI
jgi:hypothetical protein